MHVGCVEEMEKRALAVMVLLLVVSLWTRAAYVVAMVHHAPPPTVHRRHQLKVELQRQHRLI